MSKVVHQIVIADDETELCSFLAKLINREGMHALLAHNGTSTLQLLQKGNVDLLIVDYRLPDMDGLTVVQQAKRIIPELPVIMITAYGDLCSSVQAQQLGILHYLLKPFLHSELLGAINQILIQQSTHLGDESVIPWLKQLMGPSDAVNRLTSNIRRVAPSNFNVLIMGETGTGKELVATAIHQESHRHHGAFIAVDCGAIPDSLLESELFGHEKGAFSGACSRKLGKFELAAGGTLFLDEIANMPLSAQAKLLRAIQEKTIYRVGGVQPINIDVRIVAACNQNLEVIANQGDFRSDLLFRLNEFVIKTPPLRERQEDIPYLAQQFLETTNLELKKQVKGFSQPSLDLLTHYDWPGNVRQFRNIVRQAVLLAEERVTARELAIGMMNTHWSENHADKTLDDPALVEPHPEDDLPFKSIEGYIGKLSLKEMIRRQTARLERRLIDCALLKCHGNKAKAARLLQIDYKTIHTKVKEYGIEEIHHG
jgi:two-component system nitrogen regulation response regulator GlnG